MATVKKKADKSLVGKAKSALKSISDKLNPENQFGPAASKSMKSADEKYGGGARCSRCDAHQEDRVDQEADCEAGEAGLLRRKGMTAETKVAELPAKWRAKAKRIRGMTAGSDLAADTMEGAAEDLEAALTRQEAVSGVVIRDGNPTLLQDKHIKASDVRLYADPPAAQAVDLEQFRAPIGLAREVMWIVKNRSGMAEYDRLLQIIDQQAGKADADSSEAPFLQRLRAEQRELADRHQKLEAFTTSPGFKSLDETNQILLRRQENQQHNLLETLNQRIHHLATLGSQRDVSASPLRGLNDGTV